MLVNRKTDSDCSASVNSGAGAGSLTDSQLTQADFAGAPDGFQRLWTPHRMAYIRQLKKPDADSSSCPFCAAPNKSDADGLIVYRGKDCFALLNLYPYSPGHILVCTYRHISSYVDLTGGERDEMARCTQNAIRALKIASNPAGFNLGMNQGEVAGAGIAAHIHQHIVPRWLGDMNFFPIIAQTRAVGELLDDTRQRIAAAWQQVL